MVQSRQNSHTFTVILSRVCPPTNMASETVKKKSIAKGNGRLDQNWMQLFCVAEPGVFSIQFVGL